MDNQTGNNMDNQTVNNMFRQTKIQASRQKFEHSNKNTYKDVQVDKK